MLYLFLYANTSDSAQIREQFAEQHRAFRRGLNAVGTLKMAGPRFVGDEGLPDGSVMIIEAESMGSAMDIAKEDPYLINGAFTLDSVSRINPRAWESVKIKR